MTGRPPTRRSLSSRRSLAAIAVGLCAWLIWPAQSLASALVRFIHAVPGVGTATVGVNAGGGEQTLGSIGFGQVTPFRSIRSGSFKWTLRQGGKLLANGTATIGNGVYDIVVLQKMPGPGVYLGIFKAASARPGVSLVRAIHAAPELGAPMFMLDQWTMAQSMPYGRASRYYAIHPGTYTFSSMKPWLMKPGDPTLVDVKDVSYSPGVAYSEIVLGSRGQMVRVVRLEDRGAPLTRPAHFVSLVKPKHSSGSSMHGSSMQGGSMGGQVVVQPGDSLWTIARRVVGPSASNAKVESTLHAIWNMNARRIGTGDPNLIFPGQRLSLPK